MGRTEPGSEASLAHRDIKVAGCVSHSSVAEDASLPGCDIVWLDN